MTELTKCIRWVLDPEYVDMMRYMCDTDGYLTTMAMFNARYNVYGHDVVVNAMFDYKSGEMVLVLDYQSTRTVCK